MGGALTAVSHPASAQQIQAVSGVTVSAPSLTLGTGDPPASQFTDITQIIPKFDTSLGTLTGFNIGLNSTFGLTARGSNSRQESTVLVSGTGQADPVFGFDVGGSFIAIAARSGIRSPSCSDSRFIRIRACDDSETVFASFVTGEQLGPSFLASFLNTSTVIPMARFQQTLSASLDSCIGECDFTLEGYVWFGSFTVTYDYELSVAQVPAPGAIALFSLGLVGLRLARRQRAA